VTLGRCLIKGGGAGSSAACHLDMPPDGVNGEIPVLMKSKGSSYHIFFQISEMKHL
jgi:hypothetical protein